MVDGGEDIMQPWLTCREGGWSIWIDDEGWSAWRHSSDEGNAKGIVMSIREYSDFREATADSDRIGVEGRCLHSNDE